VDVSFVIAVHNGGPMPATLPADEMARYFHVDDHDRITRRTMPTNIYLVPTNHS